MEEWGNARANAYWEANVPATVRKPKEGDGVRTVEKYIRDKYEHKRYIASSIPSSKKSDIVNSDVKIQHRTVTVASEPVKVDIQPVPVVAVTQSAPVVVAQTTELIDFFNESYPATTTTTIVASRNETNNNATVFDPFAAPPTDFTEFQVAQPSPNKPAPFSFPSNFGLPNPQNPQEQLQPPKPVKPQASADAILSLYNPSIPPPHVSLNQQGGGMIPSNGLGGFQPSYAHSQQQSHYPQQMQYPQQQRQFAPQQLQQYPQQQLQYQQPQQMQYQQQQMHFQPQQMQYQQQQQSSQYQQQQQSQYQQQQQSQSHIPQNYAQQGNGWR